MTVGKEAVEDDDWPREREEILGLKKRKEGWRKNLNCFLPESLINFGEELEKCNARRESISCAT